MILRNINEAMFPSKNKEQEVEREEKIEKKEKDSLCTNFERVSLSSYS